MSPDLDTVLHPPARLRLMTMLTAVTEAEFATLRDSLDVSDSVLSKHVSALAAAGYVKSRKGVARRPAYDVDRAHRPWPQGPAAPRRGAAGADRRRGLR